MPNPWCWQNLYRFYIQMYLTATHKRAPFRFYNDWKTRYCVERYSHCQVTFEIINFKTGMAFIAVSLNGIQTVTVLSSTCFFRFNKTSSEYCRELKNNWYQTLVPKTGKSHQLNPKFNSWIERKILILNLIKSKYP